MLSADDLSAFVLTFQLAGVSTLILLLLGTPLAWWLSQTRSRWRSPIEALIALPLVLPPTVLGFYLLLSISPSGPIGSLLQALGLPSLAFSFWGLVLGSVIYSLPFVVQPLQTAFSSINRQLLEVSATLGAKSLDRFLSIVLPMSKIGYVTAIVL